MAAPNWPAPLDRDHVMVTLDPAQPQDLGAVDRLACLALVVRRRGREVRLLGASAELRELIALLGLGDVLECGEELPVEPGG